MQENEDFIKRIQRIQNKVADIVENSLGMGSSESPRHLLMSYVGNCNRLLKNCGDSPEIKAKIKFLIKYFQNLIATDDVINILQELSLIHI